jgi:hypothetical protein
VKDSARLMRLISSTLRASSQNRVAREKYGPKGRYRKLRVQTHRGVHGASFEALVGIPPVCGNAIGESYVFTVLVVRERLGSASTAFP